MIKGSKSFKIYIEEYTVTLNKAQEKEVFLTCRKTCYALIMPQHISYRLIPRLGQYWAHVFSRALITVWR